MRITFLVNYDIAALYALNCLLPKLQHHELSIFFSDKVSGPSPAPKALACLKSFDAKLVEQSQGLTGFAQFGAIQANDVNTADHAAFRSSNPELVVCIRYMTILRDSSITVPKHGVLNLHSGVLPDYQGVMASFWAMLNCESKIGTTLHWIDSEEIDTGAIIARSMTPVVYERSYLWNVLNLYPDGCANILKAIDTLNAGQKLESYEQSGPAGYYSFPTQADIDQAKFKLFSSKDSADSLNITLA